MKLKKGDPVIIIAGKDRGKTGKIESIFPRVNRVVIAGLNLTKKHVKASTRHPQGGVVEFARPINVSNVMMIDPSANKPTRLGYGVKAGQKIRLSRLSGQAIGSES